MIEPRLFLCNGATHRKRRDSVAKHLWSFGPKENVHLKLEHVARVFLEHLKPRLVDLLEIASFIFSADCGTRRGSEWRNDDTTEPWARQFRFVIPVRDRSFWSDKRITGLLRDILHFLSGDEYSFSFQRLKKDRPVDPYLSFGPDQNWPFSDVDRVLMFSGGLDSLAGAVETAERGEHLVLVSHRSNSTIFRRQKDLVSGIDARYPKRVIHIPVEVNKGDNLDREHTQRTRSFLYVALGTAVAESVKAGGVRFFENGVVSINLPIADEVVGARASRTTHPCALRLFEELCRSIAERDLIVDNPYLFSTKQDVVSTIARANAADLIRDTCSCSHTGRFQSRDQWHCGGCGQCIDRRIAILAVGQSASDPANDYVSDVFSGPRKNGYEKNIAVGYVRHALQLHEMDERQIAAQFNRELTLGIRGMPDASRAAESLIQMHKRHADAVYQVLKAQVESHSDDLLKGTMESSCLLNLVVGQQHLTPGWRRFSERLHLILQAGLPAACKSEKPRDEPHLQELCEGLLKAHDLDLEREFPFMAWSVVKTKPDFSAESIRLWIELKYIRQQRHIRKITEDIAADITKYGDNQRRVCFIIYDPSHLVLDEDAFCKPVHAHESMLVRFVR